MAGDERAVWTPEQTREVVKIVLATEEAKRFAAVFADASVSPEDLAAFLDDDARRLVGQSVAAQAWWAAVREVVVGKSPLYLALGEPLAQQGVCLNDLYALLTRRCDSKALVQALTQWRYNSLYGGPPPGITNTKGWNDERILTRLDEVRPQLDWANTRRDVRAWWEKFEEENKHRVALILRLAEELALREATILEFWKANCFSGTDNIQANLDYLDYCRLIKRQQRQKPACTESDLGTTDVGQPQMGSQTAPFKASWDSFLHPTGYRPAGISNTRGWSDAQMLAKLEGVKVQLDWVNTVDPARIWWEALEVMARQNLDFLLQLAEELALGKYIITEFYLAWVDAKTDNIRAMLNYLSYSRLKREAEKKKKAAAEKGGEAQRDRA